MFWRRNRIGGIIPNHPECKPTTKSAPGPKEDNIIQAYICDSCKEVIKLPHTAKMKEFYYDVDFEFGTFFSRKTERKVIIHLCDDCFNNLKNLAENKRSDNDTT